MGGAELYPGHRALSRRWKKGRGFDANQLQLSWTASVVPSTDTTSGTGSERAINIASTPSGPAATESAASGQLPELSGDHPRHPDLVQELPWDFITTFPEPLPDAIEAGNVSEEDAEPDRVRGMHEELSRQLLGVLTDEDKIADARRLGIDPKTRGKPTSHGGKQRLKRYFETEPSQLRRNWQALLGVYAEAFGEEAAGAFVKAIRARHAGIPLVTQAQPDTASGKPVDAESISPAVRENTGIPRDAKIFTAMAERGKGGRVIARLPVPRPLADAIAAGRFGHDEQGPVNPSADEVREITLNHAEELIDLLDDVREAQRRGLNETGCTSRWHLVELAVQKYAEDFGDHAGQQLLAYCRRQLLINDASNAKTQGRKS